MRRLINKVLPTDSDLNAFCLDAFADSSPELYQRVSGLHDRMEKVTLLLSLKSGELDELFAAMARLYPAATQRYRYLLDRPEGEPQAAASGRQVRSGARPPGSAAATAPIPMPSDSVAGVRRPRPMVWGTVALGLLLATAGWFWRDRQRQSQVELEQALEAVSQAELDVQQRRWSQVLERCQALLALSELPVGLRKRAQVLEREARNEQAEQRQFARYQARIAQPEADDAALFAYRQIGAGSVYFPEAEALFRDHAGRRSSRYLEQAEQARQRGQCAESQAFLAQVRLLLPESPQLREAAAKPCAVASVQAEPPAATTPSGPGGASGSVVAPAIPGVRQRGGAAKPSTGVTTNEETTLDFDAAATLLARLRQVSDPKQGLALAIQATRARRYDQGEDAWEYVFRFACELKERKWLKDALPQLSRQRLPELLHATDCLDFVGEQKTYILRTPLR